MVAHYLSFPQTHRIQSDFAAYISCLGGVDLQASPVGEIRKAMFGFFATQDFLDNYMELGKQVAERVGLPLATLVMQSAPTPRIFRPRQHGTSFHCDYWYGHGLNSYTIWTPLTLVEAGNSFRVCSDDKQEELYQKLVDSGKFIELEDELMKWSYPVLPEPGSSFVFHSKVLHGSPKNASSRTRVSFDFRIGQHPDGSSSKDLANYYHFKDGRFVLPVHPLQQKRVLKYICGGDNKNTFAQHALIEETARRYEMNISEQEAEIERFGYPMLKSYLDGSMDHKELDGIIIASESILDADAIKEIRKSAVPLWCALENKFLK